MSEQHTLLGRTEDEVLWFKRRSVLKAAAAWTTMGGFGATVAQQRSNIVELQGDALVNGRRITAQETVQTGDHVQTGPNSSMIFVIGNSAFQVRQNSLVSMERGSTLFSVSVLRMLTGAVVSVWGKGNSRQIVTPTITAGIRGTGVYTEIFADQGGRGYFCNCYGTVVLNAGRDQTVSQASYHQSFWGEVEPKGGRMLTQAKAINHTDEELEFLARLVDQRTAWEVAGRKGVMDGMGYMEPVPGAQHPAMTMPVR